MNVTYIAQLIPATNRTIFKGLNSEMINTMTHHKHYIYLLEVNTTILYKNLQNFKKKVLTDLP